MWLAALLIPATPRACSLDAIRGDVELPARCSTAAAAASSHVWPDAAPIASTRQPRGETSDSGSLTFWGGKCGWLDCPLWRRDTIIGHALLASVSSSCGIVSQGVTCAGSTGPVTGLSARRRPAPLAAPPLLRWR
eukprot:2193561-Prymnesium_polylepis.2